MKASLAVFCALALATQTMNAVDYSAAISKLEIIIRSEMREWEIGGVAIALVDDQQTVHAAGFGEARRDSIFRVGSVSKLFNAVAVMQQVEAGKLDLDAPLPPDVLPINPFPGAPKVTLRQMLSHRSGLQREATVGGYFDPGQPGLAATVASVRPCVLATRPEEKTRYSNLAPSIAGYMVERAAGKPFEQYQNERLLGPLKMTSSGWTIAGTPRERIIVSHIRVADGRGGWTRRDTPLFDLGTIPAGNLFSTVDDLARFASALLAGGGGLVKPETLTEMWRPQFTKEETGFGLGFVVGKFQGHRTIGHNGAVYGHSTAFVILPGEKIGVAVIGNEDIVNGRIGKIANTALSLMLEAKLGEKPPLPYPYKAPDLAELAGDYESQSFWARLEIKDGALVGNLSGQRAKFTPAGEFKFTVDSRIDAASPVEFTRGADGRISGFSMGLQKYVRVAADPPPLPPEWKALLGSYGPDFIPLMVSERHGHLYAMTENMVDYRLTPVNRNVCALPPGMYLDEHAVFLPGPDGKPHAVNFANMLLPRRKD
jgi:CubicO group peptidase (beta-lactamase class C family)